MINPNDDQRCTLQKGNDQRLSTFNPEKILATELYFSTKGERKLANFMDMSSWNSEGSSKEAKFKKYNFYFHKINLGNLY